MAEHAEADGSTAVPARYRRAALEAELSELPEGTGLDFRIAVAAAQEPETIVHGIRRLLRAGDRAGTLPLTEILIEKVTRTLEAMARRQFPQSPQDQEDACQEATIQLWCEIADTSPKEEFWEVNFKAMLGRAVSDAAKKIRRRSTGEQPFKRDETGEGVDQESAIADDRFTGDEQDPFHLDMLTEEALSVLDGNVRKAAYLLLRGMKEHSTNPEEWTVARVLGVSDRTVRTYLRQAVQQITEWSHQRP